MTIKGYDEWLTDDHYSERCDRCEEKSDDLTRSKWWR